MTEKIADLTLMVASAIREIDKLQIKLNEAISLLKQCINWDNKPMTTAISGELGDKIRKFIGRCGE